MEKSDNGQDAKTALKGVFVPKAEITANGYDLFDQPLQGNWYAEVKL